MALLRWGIDGSDGGESLTTRVAIEARLLIIEGHLTAHGRGGSQNTELSRGAVKG
ncbi:hypothetical protein TIFTF001_021638 [Ficus carica]|uniref:Uncharacterized protein n=1 Tax=Ficus carica TaxID=3494 RepID=A0AA88DC25_FICCA|nr:hypothetical protein TIFTF001_021638 [Ficus carica]